MKCSSRICSLCHPHSVGATHVNVDVCCNHCRKDIKYFTEKHQGKRQNFFPENSVNFTEHTTGKIETFFVTRRPGETEESARRPVLSTDRAS